MVLERLGPLGTEALEGDPDLVLTPGLAELEPLERMGLQAAACGLLRFDRALADPDRARRESRAWRCSKRWTPRVRGWSTP